jgi:hypothetical protein
MMSKTPFDAIRSGVVTSAFSMCTWLALRVILTLSPARVSRTCVGFNAVVKISPNAAWWREAACE